MRSVFFSQQLPTLEKSQIKRCCVPLQLKKLSDEKGADSTTLEIMGGGVMEWGEQGPGKTVVRLHSARSSEKKRVGGGAAASTMDLLCLAAAMVRQNVPASCKVTTE